MHSVARPFTGPNGREADQIRIVEIAAIGNHGALPGERDRPQAFTTDLVLHIDSRPAAQADDLALTVNYAEVAAEVEAILGGTPVALLETLAERIAQAVLTYPGVLAVDVQVHKPEAPMATDVADVAIAIRRTTADVLQQADAEWVAPVAVDSSADQAVAPQVASPSEATVGDELAADQPDVVGVMSERAAPMPADDQLSSVASELAPHQPAAVGAEAAEPATDEAIEPPSAESAEQPTVAAAAPLPTEPEDVADVSAARVLEVMPSEPVEAVLALGANQGAAKETLRTVVAELDQIPGTRVKMVSPLVRTRPVGGPTGQPDYLNAVVVVETTLSPRGLLAATSALESAYGRVRTGVRGEPRPLDIDLITVNDLVATSPGLTLPHPRAAQRAFVLVPWAHMSPGAVLPGLGGGPVAALAETAPDRPGIRWLALDWLADPKPKATPAAVGAPAVSSGPAASASPMPLAQPPRAQPPAAERAVVRPEPPSRSASLAPAIVGKGVAEPDEPPIAAPDDDAAASAEPRTVTGTLAAAAKAAVRTPPPSWDDILKPAKP